MTSLIKLSKLPRFNKFTENHLIINKFFIVKVFFYQLEKKNLMWFKRNFIKGHDK